MAIKKTVKSKKVMDDEGVPPKISMASEPGEKEEKLENGADIPTSSDHVEGDYLRQYQYKRELPLGHPASDPQPGGKAASMKAFLLSQKRVTILIPLDAGSDPKVPYSVTLNGYRLDLPVNTYVEVPEQVANVIMDSQKQTIKALDQFKAGENKEALQ